MDPCESLPIFGIITSHFHLRKGKRRERKRREKELREREGEDEERLEREAPSRCFSP